MIKNENGYTVIELVIAMGMVSIIIGLAFMVYHFSLRQIRNWQEEMRLVNSAQIFMNAVSREIFGMRQLLVVNQNTVRLINQRMDTVNVSFENEILLFRRGKTEKQLSVLSNSRFEYFGTDLNLDLTRDGMVDFTELDTDRNDYLSSTELTQVGLIEIVLVVKNNQREFETRTAVALRNLNLE